MSTGLPCLCLLEGENDVASDGMVFLTTKEKTSATSSSVPLLATRFTFACTA